MGHCRWDRYGFALAAICYLVATVYAAPDQRDEILEAGPEDSSSELNTGAGSVIVPSAAAPVDVVTDPWAATCASYRNLSVRFPDAHLEATYDLTAVVQDAPTNGWSCKAREPEFPLSAYPPFFKALLTMFSDESDDVEKTEENQQPQQYALHMHKDKHVFFTFNPCRLLLHRCNGSKGRLFKYATKLKNPDDPHEEIEQALSALLKVPTASTDVEETEVADTTECLQNVLPANTTMIYSHRDPSEQQHPNSNGFGGLWTAPDISDDPTPWEPVDPRDPYKGIKAEFRHIHVLCPNATLQTTITLTCKDDPINDSKHSVFDTCHHVNPCLYTINMTTTAACPVAVASTPESSVDRLSAAIAVENSLKGGNPLRAAPGGNVTTKDSKEANSSATESAAPSVSSRQKATPSESFSIKEDAKRAAEARASEEAQQQRSILYRLLVYSPHFFFLILRIGLCILIMAWLVYALREWMDKNMRYSQIPDDVKGDRATSSQQTNSYDSCVELFPSAGNGVPETSNAFEMANMRPEHAIGNRPDPNQRPLRGIYSSPGRRFVGVWLPRALGAAAEQAQRFSVVATGILDRSLAFVGLSGSSRRAGFNASVRESSGGSWEWGPAGPSDSGGVLRVPSRESVPATLGGGYETI